MRNTKPREMEAIVRLDGAGRFRHFVKRVADEEQAWGLWAGGWALMGTNDGRQAFPLWPAREYAALLREGDWANHEPRPLALRELISVVLPTLEQEGTLAAVFPVARGQGVVIAPKELTAALEAELEQYG